MTWYKGRTVEEALAKATGRLKRQDDPDSPQRRRCEQIQNRAVRAGDELARQLEKLEDVERSITRIEREMELGAYAIMTSMIPAARILLTRGRNVRRVISRIQNPEKLSMGDVAEVGALVGGLGALIVGIRESYGQIPERDALVRQVHLVQRAIEAANSRFQTEIESFTRSHCHLLLQGRTHGVGRIPLRR
jgi:hypothetical protein